jgi:hypothetical protein
MYCRTFFFGGMRQATGRRPFLGIAVARATAGRNGAATLIAAAAADLLLVQNSRSFDPSGLIVE